MSKRGEVGRHAMRSRQAGAGGCAGLCLSTLYSHLYQSCPCSSYSAAQAGSAVLVRHPRLTAGGGGGTAPGAAPSGVGDAGGAGDGAAAGTSRLRSSLSSVSTLTAPLESTPATPANGTAAPRRGEGRRRGGGGRLRRTVGPAAQHSRLQPLRCRRRPPPHPTPPPHPQPSSNLPPTPSYPPSEATSSLHRLAALS